MDYAPFHASKQTTNFFELNPIETLFAELKKEVQNQNVKNVKKLILVLKSSWKKMKKDIIKKIIKHTSKVCHEIIKCHGKLVITSINLIK